MPEFLFEATRGNAFEQTNNFGRRKLGWRRDEMVDVIRHYFIRKDFKIVLCSDFAEKDFEPCRTWAN